MIRPAIALFLAAQGLSACATIGATPSRCETALSGLSAASEIVSVLQAHGIAPDVAAKVGPLLALGKIGVGVACAHP